MVYRCCAPDKNIKIRLHPTVKVALEKPLLGNVSGEPNWTG
jgi:hypothetical protein